MTYYYGRQDLRAILGDMANAPSYSDILEEADELAIGYCISWRCQQEFKKSKIERARRIVSFMNCRRRKKKEGGDRIGFPRPICYHCKSDLHWTITRRQE